MDRRTYKSKPQHLVTDPRTGEITKIIHSSDTDIGNANIGANLRVFGDLSVSGNIKTTDGSTFIAGGPNVTVTTGSNGQVVISAVAASGASAALSYVTVTAEAGLTSERVLTGGTGIKVVDGGANSNVTMNINDGVVATVSGTNFSGVVKATGGLSGSLQRTVGGLSYLVGGTNVTVTSASNGQVTISAAAASGAPSTAQYLTLATDGTLSAERVLVPSTGLFSTDGGANGNFTIGVNDRFFAALTGSNFTGPTTYSAPATFSGGISGSLTRLQDGTSYIIAGNNVTVVTGSGGQITISSTGGGSGGGGDPDPSYLTLALTASLSNERVFTPGTGLKATDGGANGAYTLNINNGVVATLSGSTFTGAITAVANGGITGSITRLVSGTPFVTVPAGNVITITTGSGGQIVISGSGGGNEGAPKTAQFLTLAADPELTVERVFTPGTGLKATDGGAGAAYTLNINDGVVATISGSTFTGAVTGAANGGFTGSMTVTTAGTPFVTVPAGNVISVSTGSNGQIILSGTTPAPGAPLGAQYITLAADPQLTVERVFTPSTGLKATDGGAGGAYTVVVHDGTFAALTGSVFTGVVQHSSPAQTLGTDVFTFFSGSVRVVPGTTGAVSANRKVSLFGGDIVASGSLVLSGASVFDGQMRYPSAVGTDVFHYVSGSIGVASGYNRQVTVLAGDVVASGSFTAAAAGGITGSITVTSAGTPFITAQAGNAITVTTGSNGQIILSASISGGSGAPTTSPYVTIGNDASLSAERALTAGTGLALTDGGANSTVTLAINNGVVATVSGTTFTGAVTGASNGGFTGSMTVTTAGTPFITVPAGNIVTISTGSNGQIVLSGSVNALTSYMPLAGGTFTGAVTAVANGGITGSITVTTAGTPFVTSPAGNVITVTTGSNGQIVLSGSGGVNQGAPKGAQYLTLATDAELTSERVLAPSTGLKATDSGANGNYTLIVHDGTVAFLTGANFTGAVSHDSGGVSAFTKGTDVFLWFSGSATQAGGPTVTSANRKVILFGGDIISSASMVMSGAASFDSQLRTAASQGTDVQFFVSGSSNLASGYNRKVALFGGDVVVSGSISVPWISGSIQQLASGISYIVNGSPGSLTITSMSNGQIVISSSAGGGGGGGAPTNSQYLTLATDATLTAERVLTPSTGLFATDGGANGNYTIGVNDRFFAALTGSVFTGVLSASGGISGSIQQVGPGLSYLVGGNNITVTSASNGQITIAGTTFAPLGSAYVTIGADATLTNERNLTAGTGLTLTDGGANSTVTFAINNGVVATISGSTYTGAVTFAANGGATGSITQTTAGTPFITVPAGNAITVTTGSNGQIILSASISGGSGAPTTSAYVTIGNDASLSAERALTAGTGILIADGGANSTVTMTVDNNKFAALTGSNFTGAVSHDGAGTSALTKGTDVFFWVSGSVRVAPGTAGAVNANRKVTVLGGDAVSSGSLVMSGALFLDGQMRYPTTTASDAFLFVSGSIGVAAGYNRQVAVFAGDVVHSGNILLANNRGATGSITQTTAGTPFITVPAGNIISISTGSNGQIILSGTTPASGAPLGAQYLALAADAQLTNERVFTPSTGLKTTDGGAGGAYTVIVHDGTFAALTGSNFTGAVTVSSPGTTATTQGSDVWFYASGSVGVNTGSNRKVSVLNDTVVSGTLSVGSLNFSSFATLQITGSSQTVDIGGQTAVPLQTTNYNSDQNGAFLVQRKARGTPSAPSQALANDILGGLIARGFGAGSSYFPTTNAGAAFFIAESDFQSTSNATKFQLRLTPTGSTSTSTVLNISSEGRASFDPSGTLASTKGTDVFFYVSGSSNTSGASNRKVALFNGDVLSSGSFQANWFSGSIQKTNAGLSYLVAGSNVTITSNSNGQVTIAAAGGSGTPPGSNTQVIFNDTGAYGADAGFAFRKADGAVVATAFTSSFLSASRYLAFGQYMPIATDGYIRCGYPQLNNTVLLSTVNSVAVDSPIISTTGDGHTFGLIGSNIYQASVHNFYNEAGSSHTYIDYNYFITRCAASFTTDLTSTASVGSDVYFYVSGSIHGNPAATNASPTVDPGRQVAVFGTDVHVSGSMRFTVDTALTPTEIIKVDNGGTDYNAFTLNYGGSDMQWGNTAFYNTYNGYGVSLNGATAGVSAYDGRNGLTTDLACVSQRLSATFTTVNPGAQPTNFTFAVNANEVWYVELNGVVNCSSTGGVKFALLVPSSSNVDGFVHGSNTTAGTTIQQSRLLNPNTLQAAAINTVATAGQVRLHGTVKVNDDGGNITIGFAAGTSGQTATLFSGSHFQARRADLV